MKLNISEDKLYFCIIDAIASLRTVKGIGKFLKNLLVYPKTQSYEKTFVITFCPFWFFAAGNSQQKTITGTVTGTEDGQPVIGARYY